MRRGGRGHVEGGQGMDPEEDPPSRGPGRQRAAESNASGRLSCAQWFWGQEGIGDFGQSSFGGVMGQKSNCGSGGSP